MAINSPAAAIEEFAAVMLESAECGFALLGEDRRLLYANGKWRVAEGSDGMLQAFNSLYEDSNAVEEAQEILIGIANVLAGEAYLFEREYANAEGVYLLRVSLLQFQGRSMAMVQRIELTAPIAAHHQRWEERRLLAERERQIRELLTLEKIGAGEMSAETAEIYGRMSLRESQSEIFQSLVERYGEMLNQMADGRLYQIDYDISDRLRAMGDQLGLVHAGSRDVIDLHTNALRKAMVDADYTQSSALLEEGLHIALELMSYLVGHYRKYLWLNHNQAEYEEI